MAVSAGKILIMPKGAWDSTTTYRYLDMVTHNDSKWLCKVESCVGIEPSTLSTAYWFAWDDSNVGGSTVTFQTRQSRQDLTSGDTVATLFGKIKKWLIDMKDVAFTGSFGDLTDIPKATQSDLGLVKVDGTTITVTSDGVISSSASDVDAEDVTYDNEVSQLLSENVQDAIDETVTSINGITQTIGAKSGLPDPTSTVVANIATISDTIGDVADLPTPTDTVAENIYSLNDSLANISSNLTTENNQNFRFGYDETSEKYGYILREADTDVFIPFSSGGEVELLFSGGTGFNNAGTRTFTYTVQKNGTIYATAFGAVGVTFDDSHKVTLTVSKNNVTQRTSSLYSTSFSQPIEVVTGDVIKMVSSCSNSSFYDAWYIVG